MQGLHTNDSALILLVDEQFVELSTLGINRKYYVEAG